VLDEVETAGVKEGKAVGDATDGSRVGDGSGVSVGNGVRVGASVGGNGVAVGIDACVSATIVKAAATAVFCTSCGSVVGVAFEPHELTSRLKTAIMIQAFFFIQNYFLIERPLYLCRL
jgi:hypothetical protein